MLQSDAASARPLSLAPDLLSLTVSKSSPVCLECNLCTAGPSLQCELVLLVTACEEAFLPRCILGVEVNASDRRVKIGHKTHTLHLMFFRFLEFTLSIDGHYDLLDFRYD